MFAILGCQCNAVGWPTQTKERVHATRRILLETCYWHFCSKSEGVEVNWRSINKERTSTQGWQNAYRRRLFGDYRLGFHPIAARAQGAAMMQFVKRIWAKGRKGKAAIGCGGLLFLCSICTMVSLIWSATPQGRQATEQRNATATASALIKAETANAPTATTRPTRTPLPSNTPRPSVTIKVETPETAGANITPTTAPATSTFTPTPSLPPAPVTRSNTNLRSGPGVNYSIVGSAPAGTSLDIRARTAAGDWLLLASGAWVSADLVVNAPAVPVAANIPTPPATSVRAVAPVVVATTAPGGGSNSNAFTCIGGCATPPDPSCAIKGNVNSEDEKIYHTPGQRDYERTDIKPEEGDRWFCTPEEARAAGFRPAQR